MAVNPFVFKSQDRVRPSARAGACFTLGLAAFFLLAPAPAFAGPPFLTDDPEPVEVQHWEFYVASANVETRDGWSSTAPLFEVNYGALPNLQLHLLAPFAYSAPKDGSAQYGYGDTELGVKFRFIQEDEAGWQPMVATFPLVELPSGTHKRGLGNGRAQVFLPLWIQKSFGKWTTYGGGGYWINPGPGNRDFSFLGWLLQREVVEHLTVGAEIFHITASQVGGRVETGFNVGAVYDMTENHHLLFSVGRAFQGPTEFRSYLAYQFTFGPSTPERKEEESRPEKEGSLRNWLSTPLGHAGPLGTDPSRF